LEKINNVTVYGNYQTNKGPVMSFNVLNLTPADTAYILQNSYGIVVRTGLQCAPLIHKRLGTLPFGTIRVSISDMTNETEVKKFIQAIREIVLSLEDEHEINKKD